MKNDPAARSKAEVFFCYAGVKALFWHRFANFLHRHHLKLLASFVAYLTRKRTQIEIHPAAKIAPGIFIDHGAGVVIGETAEIEEDVVIYQGVTLGGTGKEKGKRHPTVKRGAMISAGAKVLGGFTVGEFSKIGAGAVVLKEVPAYATVVGVPARVVRINGEKITEEDLLQEKCDPLQEEICHLREMVFELEEKVEKLTANKKEK